MNVGYFIFKNNLQRENHSSGPEYETIEELVQQNTRTLEVQCDSPVYSELHSTVIENLPNWNFIYLFIF